MTSHIEQLDTETSSTFQQSQNFARTKATIYDNKGTIPKNRESIIHIL